MPTIEKFNEISNSHPSITTHLSDDTRLMAAVVNDDIFGAAIMIYWDGKEAHGHERPICVVEDNPNRGEGNGLNVCIGAFKADSDEEFVYYDSYGVDKQKPKIYTRDEAMLLIKIFEDILVKHNIRIPSPEDDEREPEDLGLYGSTCSKLLDVLEDRLICILKRKEDGEKAVENVFSGMV